MRHGQPRGTHRRVPLRLQMTRTECSAACLAMVLSHHGRTTSVPQARELLGSGRDGVSVSGLAAAARAEGLTVSIDRGASVPAVRRPAIVYLASHHFVVLSRLTATRAVVIDPSGGRQRWTRAELDRRYGGVVLQLAPAPGFRTRRMPMGRLPMVRYVREFLAAPGGRRLLGMAALLAAGLQLLALATPLLTKAFVDAVIPHDSSAVLLPCLLGIVVVAGAAGVLALIRGLVLLRLRLRSDWRLTGGFVGHLCRLPISFFTDRGRGDLLMRLSSVSTTREALTQQLLGIGMDAAMLCGYLIGLIIVAPLFALFVLPLLALHVAVATAGYRLVLTRSHQELAAKSEEQSYLVEALEAIVPLKANGVEARAQQHWAGLFARYQQAAARRSRLSAWLSGVQRALTALGPMLLLWAGVWLVLQHRMSLGGMLAANAVALSVISPLETFASSGQIYQAVRAQIERLFDVLDTPAEPSGERRLAADRITGVAVDAVDFRYHRDQPPVLADITLAVPPGGKLGVVGPSGSGKSTLGLLVLGLLRAETGVVSHDGVPLTDLDLADLRAHCGAVLQELTLFNGSIRDNLALSRPDASMDEVIDAARLAGLHDDVLALPMGYDTPVGEAGAGLSAGQRQRVALARALIHRPRMLLLDEATSHLDPRTEQLVDRALSRLSITRIVISHRLSAVRNADEIVVVDHGRIVQRGRHDDLIARAGIYADLFGPAVPNPLSSPTTDQECAHVR